MADFSFLKNPVSNKWVISAPKRAKRPDVANGTEPVCPFCPGREKNEHEAYRVPQGSSKDSDWKIRVLKNKYPFAPIHEVIIHSPDHHKSFADLTQDQNKLILTTYRHRYNEHSRHGQVVIFHNHGPRAGESLPHPHTQLAVIPQKINLEEQRLETGYKGLLKKDIYETSKYHIFCPETASWPDEVWVAPKRQGRVFGEITDDEIHDMAIVLKRLVSIFDARHGGNFPFNMHIYPGGDWYLRIVPRLKTIGGFEFATGVFVNTALPSETFAFIKKHFDDPDIEKIRKDHKAHYHKAV